MRLLMAVCGDRSADRVKIDKTSMIKFSPRKFLHGLLLAATLALPAAANAAPEDDFVGARDAFRSGDARRLDFYASRLKGYVLEPYVAYWQLRLRLEEASPAEVRRFLASYSDTPLAKNLLAEWLRLLGRTQQWQLFDPDYALYSGEDLDITCYGIQSKVRTQPEAIAEARSLWFVAKELPENCTTLFSALMQSQKISQEDVWMRVRLALENGQVAMAQRASIYLTPGQQPDARALSLIFTNPGGYLEKQQFDTRTRGGREAVMFAAYRLARSSPQQAAAHWTRLESRFSAEERAYVWGQLAQSAAMRHDPEALGWFGKAGDLSDLQLAWKVRAALRQRNWREVQAAIDEMSDKEREQSAWRYWKARALKAAGREEEALALLKPIAREYNFYGQLALEELGERISTPSAGFKPTPEEIRVMSQNPTVRRALEFYRLSLRVDATREWVWLVRNLDDRQLLTAAEIARRNELYDRAINTADKTESVHDFSLRYLAPYRDVLKVRASQMNLDEAWVYGLIRQESRFIADARSRVGAGGLMQLMPATAKWVAKKMGLRAIGDVTEIDTNVSLGTYYLKHVLDSLDGQPVLASAAYNAGPGRARAWRPDGGPAIEGAIYAETIPFSETRDYVKKVMANASYYGHAFTQQVQSIKQRLGTIGARDRGREQALGDTP
ncbi:MAG TPA: transglycosylase SLT domain-containing protein [Burkholderiales bacterium]|nr:transglycosylase SLT domain-containing protein [Burkholderiales bacterium]